MQPVMILKRLREPSFVMKVGLSALASAIVLAIVLGKVLGGAIRERSLEEAQQKTDVIAQTVGEPSLSLAFAAEPDDVDMDGTVDAVAEPDSALADPPRATSPDREGDLRDALTWVEECERILQALRRPVGSG